MKNNIKMTAVAAFGLEGILAQELENIGAMNIEIGHKAVTFEGNNRTLYRANLELRTALRVLIPKHTFRFRNEEELYKKIYAIDWQEVLTPQTTFAINSAVKSEKYTNSNFMSLKAKDAIVDKLRAVYGKRPNIDLDNPFLRLHLLIIDDDCTISFDTSGDSLHKRGYRVNQGTAPMNETLAAGMLLLAGWDGQCNLIDPMCGSGTILMEAAAIAYNIAPGLLREHFGFMNFPDFDDKLWQSLKNEARSRQRNFDHIIYGSDISNNAIQIAKQNIKAAQLDWKIIVRNYDFFKYEADFLSEDDSAENDGSAEKPVEYQGIVMLNPPYGERMPQQDIEDFYERIGDTLKQSFTGYDAWIISSNKTALKKIGLRTSKKLTLFNAGLECKYHKYEMYSGSRKSKYQTDQSLT